MVSSALRFVLTRVSMAAVTVSGGIQQAGGPYFDDLRVGDVFDWAPSMTLTSGAAAVHQSIVGDRMRLALDAELARRWRVSTHRSPTPHWYAMWQPDSRRWSRAA